MSAQRGARISEDGSEIRISGPEFIKLLLRCRVPNGSAGNKVLQVTGADEASVESTNADEGRGDASDLKIRIPTGPWDPVVVEDTKVKKLVVEDSVDLRGCSIPNTVFIYGVRFCGRVDLRDASVRGSMDLTHCVFEEGLFLDDSEIEGSLKLARISAERLSLIGLVVRGRLDLQGCRAIGEIRLFDAEIDGFVDLRGVCANAVLLKGARIRSDLQVGCTPGSPKQSSELKLLDATGSTIGGRVTLQGVGVGDAEPSDEGRADDDPALASPVGDFEWDGAIAGVSGPVLDFTRATIARSLHIVPAFVPDPGKHSPDFQWNWKRSPGHAAARPDVPIRWSVLQRLSLVGANIGGDLIFLGVRVLAGVVASGMTLGGDLLLLAGCIRRGEGWALRESLIEQPLAEHGWEAVDFSASSIGGAFQAVGSRFLGRVNLSNCQLAGVVQFSPRTVDGKVHRTEIHGDLELYLSRLQNSMTLEGLVGRGSLVMWSIESRSFIRLETSEGFRTEIDGDINLHSGKLHQFELCGVKVARAVLLVNIDCSKVIVEPSLLSNGDEALVVPSQVGHLLLRNALVRGDVFLFAIHVSGRECYSNRGLVIEDTHIVGSLRLYKDDGVSMMYRDTDLALPGWLGGSGSRPNLVAAVFGNLHIKRSEIDAECDLSCVLVSDEINLEGSRFSGILRFGPLNTEAPRGAARCRSLDMRMAECFDDLDISNLSLPMPESSDDERTGSILAQYLTVRGDLTAFRRTESSRRPGDAAFSPIHFTTIGGRIDLSFSVLSHLEISGDSFGLPPRDHIRPIRDGLILERARVGKLSINERDERSCPPGSDGCQAYPIPMTLTDVTVEVWDIGRELDANKDGAGYVNLLKNDWSFRRSTYRSLETSLRNQGHEDEANTVYRAMRDREWEESAELRRFVVQRCGETRGAARRVIAKHWQVGLNAIMSLRKTRDPEGRHREIVSSSRPAGSSPETTWRDDLQRLSDWMRHEGSRAALRVAQLGHRAFRDLLDYGTTPMRLSMVVILFLVLSWPAYMKPENFETSLQYLAVPQERFGDDVEMPLAHRSPPEWGWSDAFQVALQNHVPIIPWDTRDEWQARRQGRTQYLFFELWWNPEDLFTLMRLINWICWPLLLTFSIRKLLRQT